jgi:anthranilate phosphoribosyltransferase
MITLSQATEICRSGNVPPIETIPHLITLLLSPEISNTEKASYLIALKQRGETAEELTAYALSFRKLSTPPPPTLLSYQSDTLPFLDSCGTGGGRLRLFNVSTAAAFVAAAAGLTVTKHGNRAVTKSSGSADVLEALQIRIDLTPDQVEKQIRSVHFTFLFAPHWHPALKTLAPLRKEIAAAGHRTIFNLLGPLLNPLQPRIQILGIFQLHHGPLFQKALAQIGCPQFAVTYGTLPDGRPCGESSPWGTGETWTSHPTPLVPPSLLSDTDIDALMVENATQSASLIEKIFQGQEHGPAKQFIITNAGLALTLAKKATDWPSGCQLATQLIDSGAVWHTLQSIREWQKEHLPPLR